MKANLPPVKAFLFSDSDFMLSRIAILLILATLFPAPCALSQIPQGFNYQAVAFDEAGIPIINTSIEVRITIQSAETGGTIFWQELHSPVLTNGYGMFTMVVGTGTRETGTATTFNEIDWSISTKFIKTDVNHGGWKTMGSAQLWSVPYSLATANFAGSLNKLEVEGITDSLEEPLFEVRNKNGQTVFAVYNEGVRVYVGDGISKARKGGFAIGSMEESKANPYDLFYLDSDSIRFYLYNPPEGKPVKGGFAIGSMEESKGVWQDFLLVTTDSTIIATSNQARKVSIRNPLDNMPLFNIDGSLRMGYDESKTAGSINFDGTKFYTYGESKNGSKSDDEKEFVVTGSPEVITESVTNITRNSFTITATVLTDGGSEIIARGICWGTTAGPLLTTNTSVTVDGGTGSFTALATSLKGSTTYYARAFATNSRFTSYGEDVMFTTPEPVLPKVTTVSVSSVTSTTAVSGGIIIDDGAAEIIEKGVCWNTTGNPVLTDNFTTDGPGSGEFMSNLTSLLTNTTYFVRAYATNSVGTAYGEVFSFSTSDLPVLSTNPITAVTGTSATSGGNIFAGGELSILQRGVCWNTTGNPTLEDSFTDNGSGSGSFVSSIDGLTLGTTYFVRAYATNATGTAYGNEYFFTTINVPTVVTDQVSLVTGISATCGGNVTLNGGAMVTERGLVWNTTGDPTKDDSFLILGEGHGAFSGEITGLTIGTDYYVRAYAINIIGIAYGETKMFTTQNFATVLTAEVTDITYTTATGGGNVTSDGGALITQRGVCWNTTGSPTVTDSKTSDGTGTGTFVSKLTGLAANNTYFVRAYATNSIGTTYGPEISFASPTIVAPEPGLPVVGTVRITTSNDGYHTGGYISSDGGSPVTQRGVCWSTSENPTLTGTYTIDGSGTGLFNSLITDLDGCGVTYYVRAYATNSTGTGYGNQLIVTSGGIIVIDETTVITEITRTSAVSGGIISSDGGCEIVERGICWSRKPNPTINDLKSVSGSGTGSFSAALTDLIPNYTYYVRAYATNIQTTNYGPEISFTTQSGTLGLKIGQFYAGGYIFYLDETGDHGIVSAPEDAGVALWGCGSISIPGTLPDIGTGASNTAIILANCPEEGIAARLCADMDLNGYTDWFLPSIMELDLIYRFLYLEGIANLKKNIYWSSTEDPSNDGTNAFIHNFTNGVTGGYPKSDSNFLWYVRAARSF